MEQVYLGIKRKFKMTVKRLTTEKQRQIIKYSKKYKGKSISDLSQKEKDKLLEILSKKAGIL